MSQFDDGEMQWEETQIEHFNSPDDLYLPPNVDNVAIPPIQFDHRGTDDPVIELPRMDSFDFLSTLFAEMPSMPFEFDLASSEQQTRPVEVHPAPLDFLPQINGDFSMDDPFVGTFDQPIFEQHFPLQSLHTEEFCRGDGISLPDLDFRRFGDVGGENHLLPLGVNAVYPSGSNYNGFDVHASVSYRLIIVLTASRTQSTSHCTALLPR